LWEATDYQFVHTDPFYGEISRGQEDGGVIFGTDSYSNPTRQLWVEGSYLGWNQSNIDNLKQNATSNNFAASTFHLQLKNTSNFPFTSQYIHGWQWTNLPGAIGDITLHNGFEYREYITRPLDFVASANYYHQAYWSDYGYEWGTPSSISPDTQIIYSDYMIWNWGYVFPITQDWFKDDVGKLCFYPFNATTADNGNYYGHC
jgi:hypothetical protein